MYTFDPTRQPHNTHPEQRVDEVCVGDYDMWYANSDRIKWQSKRIGNNPLDQHPSRTSETYRSVPVFALRSEVLQNHYRLRFGA